MQIFTVFSWGVLASGLSAFGLLLMQPGALTMPQANSGVVHLITLGVITGGFYPLLGRSLEKAYDRGLFLRPLLLPIAAVHFGGVALLFWGFFRGLPMVAHWGGHYLVPTAILAGVIQGLVTMFRRTPGTPRSMVLHLPTLGILLGGSLGALLIMEATGFDYGLYKPPFISIHALAGGYLFFLPLMLLEGQSRETGTYSSPQILITLSLAAGGLLALTLGVSNQDPRAISIGLVALGGLSLWLGVPGSFSAGKLNFSAVRRAPLAAVGLLLLLGALRAWRGESTADNLRIGWLVIQLFLFTLALPEMLVLLAPEPKQEGEENMAVPLGYLLGLFGSGLLIAAHITGVALLVQMGALIWLVTLLWFGWRLLKPH